MSVGVHVSDMCVCDCKHKEGIMYRACISFVCVCVYKSECRSVCLSVYTTVCRPMGRSLYCVYYISCTVSCIYYVPCILYM